MRLQRLNANVLSSGGIAFVIGAMVDAAIVMIENVQKHIESATLMDEKRWRTLGAALAYKKA